MGGSQHSKHRGKGDAPELILPYQMTNSSMSIGAKSVATGKTSVNLSPPVGLLDGKLELDSKDEPLEGKWEHLMEGMISTPAQVIRNKSNDTTHIRSYHHLQSADADANIRRQRQVYSKYVLETMPTLPRRKPMPENSAHNLLSLIPPKIRLQILSPVHSRQQMLVPSELDIKNKEEDSNDIVDSTATNMDEGSSILFLKQPMTNYQRFENESTQEVLASPRMSITPRQSKHTIHSSTRESKYKEHQHEDTDYINQEQLEQQPKKRRQLPKRPPPPQRNQRKKTNFPPCSLSPTIAEDNEQNQQQLNYSEPANRSGNRYSKQVMDSCESNKKSEAALSEYRLPQATLRTNQKHQNSRSILPPENFIENPYGCSSCDGERSETRQTTALSQSSSRRKLKVRGLRNFVDSHKSSCPPLWAKQFPCRSKFHPDNYLYDFEGFNAPKRPVAAMEKCTKKCGRCNRCGIYAESLCGNCNNCPHDCSCTNTKSSRNGSFKKTEKDSPGPAQFAPTAEHFISQLFGNGWSQTQKIEVNTLAEPDKPRLNLHQASSNNPLKIKTEKPEEANKPVNATGYDSYTPVPDPHPQLHPAYPPFPYGYGYPGYPTPASPYPYPYYPTYMAPPPMPSPYYGYPSQVPLPPSYSYPATAQ